MDFEVTAEQTTIRKAVADLASKFDDDAIIAFPRPSPARRPTRV